MRKKGQRPSKTSKRRRTSMKGNTVRRGGNLTSVPSCRELIRKMTQESARHRDTTRGNRGEIEGNPFWIHTSSEETVTEMVNRQWYSADYATKKKAKSLRRNALNEFRVNPKIIEQLNSSAFHWIDQGRVGGCSFACLSNVCQLGGIETPWSIERLVRESGFREVYVEEYGCDDSGYNEWFSVLATDFCGKIPDFNTVLTNIKYLPFKMRGVHNKILGTGLNQEEYGQAVFNHIVHLLNEGNVVGVPFLEHFITVIGHNGAQLLFLGTFGDTYDQGGLHVMTSMFNPVFVGDALQSCIYAPL